MGRQREGAGEVSKRPTTGGAPGLSAMRGLVGYLRDRSIGFKLGLIMLVPTLATVVVGFGALANNIGTAHDADRARILAGLSGDAGGLVHSLQDERAAAIVVLSAKDADTQKKAADKYKGLFVDTDAATKDYTAHRAALTGLLPPSFRALLSSIDDQLTSLTRLRQQLINGGSQVVTSTATFQYGNLITSLLGIRDSSSQLAGDSALSYEMRTAAAVSQRKEYQSQERILVLQILIEKEMKPTAQHDFIGTLTGQDQALAAFKVVATPAQQALYNQLIAGPDLREAQLYQNDISAMSPGPLTVNFTTDQWDSAMVGWANLMRKVEQRIDEQTVADAKTLRDKAQGQVYLYSGLLAGLVLVAVLIAWFVARSMARSLRELRHGALAVAQYGLPQAVARLRDPTLSTQMAPHLVAQQIAEPLPVRSRDEFGQVTEAFNAVHLEAVRTAAEQAALRSSVSTMFVNLARRSQILVDRLIGHLDRLERGEEDPDRLAELFQLDHLATRMRRNDENLLVLAGADSTRVQREPAALIDVLRAAQSEVEHYTRIEFGVIDRDIEVAAHAVNDLVHLVAELFDNATAFSPPDSTVIVEARRVGDRAVLYVEDHGIGISPEQLAELNERLATPPMVDVAVSRMMGLVVVARLAARHGVKVEVRPAPERGTVADVLLPTSVLVSRAVTGRGPSAGTPLIREVPTGRPNLPNQPRTTFAPLALESGPTAGGRTPAGAGAPPMGGFGTGPTGYAGPGSPPVPGSPPPPIPGPPGVPAGFGIGPDPYRPEPANGRGPSIGSGPRQVPPWSDLTGAANGSNGSGSGDRYPGRPAPVVRPGDPLPQRRSTESGPVEGELTDDDVRIPRQVPASPEARGEEPGTGIIDALEVDLVEDPAPPPAWPPVPPRAAPELPEPAAPHVPEELAAALDITSEIPRVKTDRDNDTVGWNIGSGPAWSVPGSPVVPAPYTPPPLAVPLSQQPAEQRLVAPEPARVKAYADETMELPIFRELESAWFRARPGGEAVTAPAPQATAAPAAPEAAPRPAPVVPQPYVPQGAAPPPVVPASTLTSGGVQGTTAGSPDMGSSPTSAGRTPGPEPTWRTAADDGWTAASQAADPQVDGTTSAGLPRRVPMAQLVPGGVDKNTATTNRRSPEQVRGLLSAYHRGVQRGRTRTGDDAKTPESTASGNPPHGGKEQEA